MTKKMMKLEQGIDDTLENSTDKELMDIADRDLGIMVPLSIRALHNRVIESEKNGDFRRRSIIYNFFTKYGFGRVIKIVRS